MKIALLAGLMFAFSAVAAEPTPPAHVPPVFIPVQVLYMQGQILGAKVITKIVDGKEEQALYATLKECTAEVQAAAIAVQQGGKIPAGGSMKVTCFPAPALDAKYFSQSAETGNL